MMGLYLPRLLWGKFHARLDKKAEVVYKGDCVLSLDITKKTSTVFATILR